MPVPAGVIGDTRGPTRRAGLDVATEDRRPAMRLPRLILTLAISICASTSSAEELSGLADVIDGDTLDVGSTRVRLFHSRNTATSKRMNSQ
jgi:hypothetical protein